MSGENPYTPPLVGEPQAPGDRSWYLEGISLLARNGAVLPKVDLNTGETAEEMRPSTRAFAKPNFLSVGGTVVIAAIYFMLPESSSSHSLLAVLGLFVAFLLFNKFLASRRGPSGQIRVCEYLGEKTIKGPVARAKWRGWIYLPLLLLLFSDAFVSVPADMSLMMSLLVLAGVTANILWGIFDKPAARTNEGPPGWMRITPLHPDAVRHLSRLQDERDNPA